MKALNINDAAQLVRINQGTPAGENAGATVARGILGTDGSVRVAGAGGKLSMLGGGKSENVLVEDFLNTDTNDQIAMILPSGAAKSGATGVLNHIYTPGGNVFAGFPLGTQTLFPAIVATGLELAQDQTAADGYELATHFCGATGRPFIVGSDPAFFFECTFTIDDASGVNPLLVGFRRAEVNNGTYTSYLDYAALGCNTSADPMLIKQLTGLAGTDVATSTTQTVADARKYTVRVNVSKTGVVTFKHDAAVQGQLAAPTAGAAFTFADGTPVMPFFQFIQTSDLAASVVIQKWTAAYQDLNA